MRRVFVILERGRRSYQYIVHVNDNLYSSFCPFILEWSEDVVHHILKSCGGVAESEIHDHGFIQSILCLECSFVLVTFLNTDFVKASFYVELGEDKCVSHFGDQFWYERKRISIANCPFVNAPIVLDWPLRPIGFSKEEK